MTNLKTPNHSRWETIDELSQIAGASSTPPPLPERGIPKQWLPKFIRLPLQIIVLPFIWLDLASQWVAKKIISPPFCQEGQCKKRGNCCHYILIPEPKSILTRFFYFWFTQVNGFFLRSSKVVEYKKQKMVVMGCRHLKKTGSCAHYFIRPMICRQWPLIKHFAHPVILKGCGFRAALKKPKEI